MAVSHVSLDLCLRSESRNRVDNDYIDSAGADKRLSDLERLLTVIRLGYPEIIYIDSEVLGIYRIESMLSIDECSDSSPLLALCDRMERKRGLSR